MNVKRQQCLSVSKHNSKQQIFQKKIATKTTVCHTASATFAIFRVCAPVFSLCLCYLFIFGVSFLFVMCHFHFFTFGAKSFVFCLPRREMVIVCEWAKEQSRSLLRIQICVRVYVCLCNICECEYFLRARVSHISIGCVYVCMCHFFLSPSISHSRMRERVNIWIFFGMRTHQCSTKHLQKQHSTRAL